MAVGNLEFIKSASGTSVSSLSVTDCFSADYDVYAVVSTSQEQTGTSTLFGYIRFINSGGVISTANYDYASLRVASFEAFAEIRGTNATSIQNQFFLDTENYEESGGIVAYVYNPYDSSSYTFLSAQSTYFNNANGGMGSKGIGVYKVAEQVTGVNILVSSATLDDINLKVYGVK